MKNGNVTVVHCTYDPETKKRKRLYRTKGQRNDPLGSCTVMQLQAEVRLYENIVDEEKGVYNEEDGSLNLNPNSLDSIERTAIWSLALADAKAYDSFQFVRNGYFCIDSKDSTPDESGI